MIANYKQAVPFVKLEPDKNTLLLLHGENLLDSSGSKRILTNHGATISTAQKRFGESSLYFNGNSYLLITDPINFGNNDFTIDWWEYVTGSNTRFSSAFTSDTRWGGMIIGFSGRYVYATNNSTSWNLVNSANIMSVTLSEWIHWAVVRQGIVLTTYRNGVEYGSATINGSIYYDAATPMAIGGYRAMDQNLFKGYIDEFRISKVARWTSNFTPPDEPYPDLVAE